MKILEELELLRDEYLEVLDDDLMELPPLIKVVSDNLNVDNIHESDIDLYEILTNFIEAIKFEDLRKLPLLLCKSFDSISDIVDQLSRDKDMTWRQYKCSFYEHGSLVLADGSCILNFQNRGLVVAKDISGWVDNWNNFSYVLCSLSPNFKEMYFDYFKMEFDYLLKDNSNVIVPENERDNFIKYVLDNVYCNSDMDYDKRSYCEIKLRNNTEDEELIITSGCEQLNNKYSLPSSWCKFILAYKNKVVVKVILYSLLGIDGVEDSDIRFDSI